MCDKARLTGRTFETLAGTMVTARPNNPVSAAMKTACASWAPTERLWRKTSCYPFFQFFALILVSLLSLLCIELTGYPMPVGSNRRWLRRVPKRWAAGGGGCVARPLGSAFPATFDGARRSASDSRETIEDGGGGIPPIALIPLSIVVLANAPPTPGWPPVTMNFSRAQVRGTAR